METMNLAPARFNGREVELRVDETTDTACGKKSAGETARASHFHNSALLFSRRAITGDCEFSRT
jgi:hypothetical protein